MLQIFENIARQGASLELVFLMYFEQLGILAMKNFLISYLEKYHIWKNMVHFMRFFKSNVCGRSPIEPLWGDHSCQDYMYRWPHESLYHVVLARNINFNTSPRLIMVLVQNNWLKNFTLKRNAYRSSYSNIICFCEWSAVVLSASSRLI